MFVIEGYLDIALAIMLYFNSEASNEKSGDVIDMYLVGFFSVACIVVPFGGMLFLFLNREAVREIEAEGSDEEKEGG